MIAELAAHLHQVEAAHLPRALGTWGSALWAQIDLEVAAYLNRRALRLARAAGDAATVADLLQRRGYIMAHGGDHRRALALAEQAGGIFDRIGDRAGRGRAAVDQGLHLYYLRRWRAAIEAHRRAAELLPPQSLPRNRFAAYLGSGFCYLELGDLNRARRSAEDGREILDQAETQGIPDDPWDRGRLVWFTGSLCWKMGELCKAEQNFSEAVAIFQRLHYGTTALVLLYLAEVQLEQGKGREAWQTCGAIRPLLRPLERNPIISGALVELLRLGERGLSLDKVQKVRAVIERQSKGRDTGARRAWRALVVRP